MGAHIGSVIFWATILFISFIIVLVIRFTLIRLNWVIGIVPDDRRSLAISALCVAALIYVGAPPIFHLLSHAHKVQTDLTYANIGPVIQRRCVSCHSRHPTNAAFTSPPMGLQLDSYQDLRGAAPEVGRMSVASEIMPLGNMTAMTKEERVNLGKWIAAGCPF